MNLFDTYILEYEKLKKCFHNSIRSEFPPNDLKCKPDFKVISECDSVNVLFDTWIEQKIIREICKENLGFELVKKFDKEACE